MCRREGAPRARVDAAWPARPAQLARMHAAKAATPRCVIKSAINEENTMTSRYVIIALAFSLSLLGGCTSSSADSTSATQTASKDAPPALAKAWSKAKAGENPSTQCAVLKGSLMAAAHNGSSNARDWMAQCNFDIPVAYFNALLDEVDAGDRTCHQFMTSMATQLSALTMSVDGLHNAMDRGSAGDSDAASQAMTGAVTSASSVGAKGKVKAALSRRAIATCPIMKMYMKS